MADTAIIWEARTLLRGARAGTLCTAQDGQPFGALVTPRLRARPVDPDAAVEPERAYTAFAGRPALRGWP